MTDFEKTICELKSAGGKLEESEIVSQLLSAMPESYQTVTTAIDIMFCQDESSVTVDFVKNKLLMEESRQTKNKSEVQEHDAAFNSGYRSKFENHRGNYRSFQQRGGTSRNFSQNASSSTQKFPFKCHNCGIIGHKREQCRRNPRNNRRGFGNGSHKGQQQANMVKN